MSHATAKTHVSRLLTKLVRATVPSSSMLAYESGIVVPGGGSSRQNRDGAGCDPSSTPPPPYALAAGQHEDARHTRRSHGSRRNTANVSAVGLVHAGTIDGS